MCILIKEMATSFTSSVGYRLWKEGLVQSIFVEPNVRGSMYMFLVKCRVQASMEHALCYVYGHLDKRSGDLIYSKCSCKAGKRGCCKHVAALLLSLGDYSNLGYPVK